MQMGGNKDGKDMEGHALEPMGTPFYAMHGFEERCAHSRRVGHA